MYICFLRNILHGECHLFTINTFVDSMKIIKTLGFSLRTYFIKFSRKRSRDSNFSLKQIKVRRFFFVDTEHGTVKENITGGRINQGHGSTLSTTKKFPTPSNQGTRKLRTAFKVMPRNSSNLLSLLKNFWVSIFHILSKIFFVYFLIFQHKLQIHTWSKTATFIHLYQGSECLPYILDI